MKCSFSSRNLESTHTLYPSPDLSFFACLSIYITHLMDCPLRDPSCFSRLCTSDWGSYLDALGCLCVLHTLERIAATECLNRFYQSRRISHYLYQIGPHRFFHLMSELNMSFTANNYPSHYSVSVMTMPLIHRLASQL